MRKPLADAFKLAAHKTGKPLKPVDDHEVRTIAGADEFYASRFMGAGKYELRRFDTLDLMMGFVDMHPKERWMPYASKKAPDGATSRSVLVTPRTLVAARELMEKRG